ncbi:MAG TPA: hypothetical protein VKY22_02990 [Bradyrhizobium sp.]|nr:hypothetical protein [Bradyrhizobium sp.]
MDMPERMRQGKYRTCGDREADGRAGQAFQPGALGKFLLKKIKFQGAVSMGTQRQNDASADSSPFA